jgi:hypothetical protein
MSVVIVMDENGVAVGIVSAGVPPVKRATKDDGGHGQCEATSEKALTGGA